MESTGLDRVDSNKGYTDDNVVPCCGSCNQLKNELPYKYFVVIRQMMIYDETMAYFKENIK